jgi:hypothetical protein
LVVRTLKEKTVIMERILTGKKIALLSGTRVALGVGIGMLLSRRLSNKRRRAIGLALAGAGALSTIPLAIVIGRSRFRGRRSAA